MYVPGTKEPTKVPGIEVPMQLQVPGHKVTLNHGTYYCQLPLVRYLLFYAALK